MKENIKISIILPVFNTPHEILKSCIDSVRQQTYQNYELIVVDDGSKTECADGIEKLCGNISNKTVIHRDNEGVSKARNEGMKIASGEYLLFLDADNALPENTLELYNETIQDGTDIIIGLSVMGTRTILNGRDTVLLAESHEESFLNCSMENIHDKNELVSHLLSGHIKRYKYNSAYFGDGPCGKLYRTEIAKLIPFSEHLKWSEDTIWLIKFIYQSADILFLKAIVYNNIEYEYSATRRFRENCLNEFTDVYNAENEIDFLFSNCKEALAYKRFIEILLVARLYFFHKDSTVVDAYREFKLWCSTPEVKNIANDIIKYLKPKNIRFAMALIYAFLLKSKLYRFCFLLLKLYSGK